MRAINLLGSALFGLAITNLIWLGSIYYNEDPDSVLFKISFHGENIIDESFRADLIVNELVLVELKSVKKS